VRQRVLIGDTSTGQFKGFWAEFEGKEVTKYEEEKLSYTLFAFPWGSREDETGYRVYKADERDVSQPRYELLPTGDDPSRFDREEKYHVAYNAHGLVSSWPIFAKHMEDEYFLPVKNIDPGPGYHRRWIG
jgi:hypothetical protein